MKKLVAGVSAAFLIATSSMAVAGEPVRPSSVKLANSKSVALNGQQTSGRTGASMEDANSLGPLMILVLVFAGFVAGEYLEIYDLVELPGEPDRTPTS